ncbi:MAG: KEOPS complex subunit Cgi121 [Promethearchaeota archaeon]
MIVKEFNIPDLNLHYFVGINQIEINLEKFINNNIDEEKKINQFFNEIKAIQDKYKNTVVQFIKDKYLLNEDHVFTACYYVEKAFLQNKNISNKKSIELLLYLAASRQIDKSIAGFGIDYSDLKKGKLIYCIIAQKNSLNSINVNLTRFLQAREEEININRQSDIKINAIKNFFEISDNQVSSVLQSYGTIAYNLDINSSSLISALYELICEKMALLYAEK